MPQAPNVYECLIESIGARLDADSRTSPVEVVNSTDMSTVRQHARLIDQPLTYGRASFCQECGQPAPCETIRRLATTYGCDE